MKFIVTVLFVFTFYFIGCAQSVIVKRLELKRLELENVYRSVGIFDTISGIAPVYDNGRESYIDTNSKLLLPMDYVTTDFSDGVGIYHDIEQNTFKAIDKGGNFIKEFKNIYSLQGFKKGRSIFSAPTGEGIMYGVMDFNGNIIIKNKYPYIERISENYYFVNNNQEGAGIINAIGDTIIPLQFGIFYIDTSNLHFIGYRKDVGYAIFDSLGQVMKFGAKKLIQNLHPSKVFTTFREILL